MAKHIIKGFIENGTFNFLHLYVYEVYIKTLQNIVYKE